MEHRTYDPNTNKTVSTISKEWTTPDLRNMPSTTNLEEEEIVDDLGNDGNASMPEQVSRPKPWGKMMMISCGERGARIIEKHGRNKTYILLSHEQKIKLVCLFVCLFAMCIMHCVHCTYCGSEKSVIFVRIEDSVRALGAKSLNFPPSSLFIKNFR